MDQENNKTAKPRKNIFSKKLIVVIVVILLAVTTTYLLWNYVINKSDNESATNSGTSNADNNQKVIPPEDIPSELVIYSPSKVINSFSSNPDGKNKWSITIESESKFQDVKTAIAEQYSNGWTKTAEFNSDITSVTNYDNGKYIVVIDINQSETSENQTEIVYSLITK